MHTYREFIFFYKKYLLEPYLLSYGTVYTASLQVCLPQRQHHTCFTTSSFKKIRSTGLILSLSDIALKYYKRSFKANTGHILFLQKIFLNSLKYLYLYYVINFNYRQWLFFQKFMLLISPQILILQHKKSYNTYYRPIKRLKRRVLSLILKN